MLCIRHDHVQIIHPNQPVRIDPTPPRPIATPQVDPVQHLHPAPCIRNNPPIAQHSLRRSRRIRRVPNRLLYE